MTVVREKGPTPGLPTSTPFAMREKVGPKEASAVVRHARGAEPGIITNHHDEEDTGSPAWRPNQHSQSILLCFVRIVLVTIISMFNDVHRLRCDEPGTALRTDGGRS